MDSHAHPSKNPEKLFTQSSIFKKVPDDLRREIDHALITRDPDTYKGVYARFELEKHHVSFTAFYYYARRVRYQAALSDHALILAPPDDESSALNVRLLSGRLGLLLMN